MNHFFDDAGWPKSDFSIPVDPELRRALLKRMQEAHASDLARVVGNEATKRALLCRILAVKAYDSVPS